MDKITSSKVFTDRVFLTYSFPLKYFQRRKFNDVKSGLLGGNSAFP